ncbi:MAG: glycine/betaine ABC transporter substrate-binding protein [Actinobacteria bacterium 13_2_20CM_2_71_6]|nr:MAG: glycine/betaine ABC transporter substrate-binding protein [Actinobacteria bacterium 13_2_20CM_2_71_6]
MNGVSRVALGLVGLLATAGLAAGCGKAGSSGTQAPASGAAAGGCAPVAGTKLVVLDDDKHLQNADNIIAAVNSKVATPELIAALDKVAAALDGPKLISLNKATDIDHKTPPVAAQEFAQANNLTSGITKGTATGRILVGAANFTESQSVAELYKIVLTAAGYSASTQTIGDRELYEPSLEKGEIQVVPEYAATLTEFLNGKANGKTAAPKASSDVDKTVAALKELGSKYGLSFGQPAKANDQNAFAVTSAFADKYGVKTLSDFAGKCSGKDTILGGPAECPKRPFCQQGLESTYKISFGQFKSLDTGGPLTKQGLTSGQISIGLVFSSDAALAG